jgi:hypothetical protein
MLIILSLYAGLVWLFFFKFRWLARNRTANRSGAIRHGKERTGLARSLPISGRGRAVLWGLFFLLSVVRAQADWINLTGAETAPNIAEITVFDDRVEVALEVYVGDLEVFEDLIPDDWLKDLKVDRPPLADRLERFSEQGLRFVTDKDETLQAEMRLAEPRARKDRYSPFAGMVNPYTRLKAPEAPADKRVLYAELVYPFRETAPQTLTISPPRDADGNPSVTIGFIAYHKSVPITDFRYLAEPATVRFDWDDPWYSRFDNPNLTRHHKSALMSFLYVEPYEVRHEILTRVKDLDAWMDLGLRGDRYIEVDELEPLKQRIGAFLLNRNPVLVDGEPLKPILDRANYVEVSLTGIQLVERPERLEIATAIVGVIITYITDGMPQKVTVNWELFTDQIQRVPATATDPAGPLPTFLTPEDNVHTWTNFLKNYEVPTVQSVAVVDSLGDIRFPWLTGFCSLLCVPLIFLIVRRKRRGQPTLQPLIGLAVLAIAAAAAYPFAWVAIARPAAVAGDLPPERARELLHVLLRNVYRAFDFREEEDVYDKLAVSVSGEQLAEIYLQNRRSFSIQQAGGAQAKIQSVEIQDATADRQNGRPLSYAIQGEWVAEGTIGHWGHVHTRRNRYKALVTITAIDESWKITDLEILDEQRIDPTTVSAGANAPVAQGAVAR